jgi:DNA-binding MarR family transcriptional regulator
VFVSESHRSLPTAEQLHIWRNYIETAETLRSILGGRLLSETSLSSGDYQVLLALSEAADTTLRSSELAESIGWERSRLSHHLGRMEKRGLVGRKACSDIAHGVDVTLTQAGASLFRSGSVPHLRAVRELFIDAFTPTQLQQIEEQTRALRSHLDLD